MAISDALAQETISNLGVGKLRKQFVALGIVLVETGCATNEAHDLHLKVEHLPQ